jgi:hypothetical protein
MEMDSSTGMGMEHGHKAWTVGKDMQHNKDMLHGCEHVPWTWTWTKKRSTDMDMGHLIGHALGHGRAELIWTWLCTLDMDTQHGHGQG